MNEKQKYPETKKKQTKPKQPIKVKETNEKQNYQGTKKLKKKNKKT